VIFSYLSPHFYTHNGKILLKRTDGLRNPSTTENFVKIAQGTYNTHKRKWQQRHHVKNKLKNKS